MNSLSKAQKTQKLSTQHVEREGVSRAMKACWTVAVTVVLLGAASNSAVGQMRGSGGAPSSRPSNDRRFRSSKRLVPSPAIGRPRLRPVRSLWFGLIGFDRSWLWTPGAVDEMLAAPPMPSQRDLIGGLQLDVDPRRALVYADGWYVGLVDEFSGYYHHLDLDAGWHTIEILAPDYEPLIVDVVIAPGRTTTYRGTLGRAAGRH